MQILRSSRGLLVVGGLLAVAAFVLVVLLLNNNNKSTTSTVAATSTPGGPTATAIIVGPTPIPTVGLQVVQAIRDVPTNIKFTNPAQVTAYFKDQPLSPGQMVPGNAIDSIYNWEAIDTHVLSGTAFISGTIQMVTTVRKGSSLLSTDYKVLPVSPPTSLAYSIRPGRVAVTVQLSALQTSNLVIQPGDVVDLLLTIRQREVNSLESTGNLESSTKQFDPVETQQLISNVRVINVGLAGMYTLEMPLQDALVVKYVRDTTGNLDLALVSAQDVKDQTISPKTNAVVPEYFRTPEAFPRGTAQNNGVLYPFATPYPTLTPQATPGTLKR